MTPNHIGGRDSLYSVYWFNCEFIPKHPHRHTQKCLSAEYPLAQMSWHIKLITIMCNVDSPESATDFCIERIFGKSQGFPNANHLQKDKPQVRELHYLSLLLLWFSCANDRKNLLPWPRNNVTCHPNPVQKVQCLNTNSTLQNHENPEKLFETCALCWPELCQPRISSRWNFFTNSTLSFKS